MASEPGLGVNGVDPSPLKLGGAVCSKRRSDLMDIREALLMDRCATRISKRMLRDVEQTAPALASRRASPPNLGGDCAHRYIGPYLGQLRSMTARISWIPGKTWGPGTQEAE